MERHDPGRPRAGSPLGALEPFDITTEEVTRRLSRRLRQMIGPGRAWSYKGVAHLTGIDERSLHAYARGETCPNLAKYKRLLSVLGPELSADIDVMFGWPARASASVPGAIDIRELAAELRASLAAIDEAIERRTGSSHGVEP